MTEKEKFDRLIETLGVTSYRLAKDLKMSTERINKVIRGETKNPSVSIYSKIKSAYPQVSSDWLLTGKGDVIEVEEKKEDLEDAEEVQKLKMEVEFIRGLYEKAISEKISLQLASSKKDEDATLRPDRFKKSRFGASKQVSHKMRRGINKKNMELSGRVPGTTFFDFDGQIREALG